MENTIQHHGIKGMKWGVRRYQNRDGSLTAEGKKRYERDIADNISKKKENRIDTSSPDPKRWVKEDIERGQRLTKAGSNMIRELSNIEKETRPRATKKRMDLSKMTDQEMRQRINRELIERQYNDMFGEMEEPKISAGRKKVTEILKYAGEALGITGSALSIALAIKELKG